MEQRGLKQSPNPGSSGLPKRRIRGPHRGEGGLPQCLSPFSPAEGHRGTWDRERCHRWIFVAKSRGFKSRQEQSLPQPAGGSTAAGTGQKQQRRQPSLLGVTGNRLSQVPGVFPRLPQKRGKERLGGLSVGLAGWHPFPEKASPGASSAPGPGVGLLVCSDTHCSRRKVWAPGRTQPGLATLHGGGAASRKEQCSRSGLHWPVPLERVERGQSWATRRQGPRHAHSGPRRRPPLPPESPNSQGEAGAAQGAPFLTWAGHPHFGSPPDPLPS